MSEYQYYEFQAIDRPLTEREMSELRAYSTRARITPTSFVNDYSWGNFKGDEGAWMERYFDAFLYLANWGTHVLKLRLPARLLDAKTARMYCVAEQASARAKDGKVIVSFVSEDEGGDDDDVDGTGRLSSLISVRAELAHGDLRALYLGWLLCLQNGDLDDDALEPPVPAGLRQLSASLEGLVKFLRIGPDLVAAAATASPPIVLEEPKVADVRAWVTKISAAEKSELLARIVAGDTALASELFQRMRCERGSEGNTGKATSRRRTAAELLREAENAAEERRRLKAGKLAKEQGRRAREAAIARAKHLDNLAGREPTLWKQVEQLIATKQPKRYDQALILLADLRDLAARNKGTGFLSRLEALRAEHSQKRTLINRLHKAGL